MIEQLAFGIDTPKDTSHSITPPLFFHLLLLSPLSFPSHTVRTWQHLSSISNSSSGQPSHSVRMALTSRPNFCKREQRQINTLQEETSDPTFLSFLGPDFVPNFVLNLSKIQKFSYSTCRLCPVSACQQCTQWYH